MKFHPHPFTYQYCSTSGCGSTSAHKCIPMGGNLNIYLCEECARKLEEYINEV